MLITRGLGEIDFFANDADDLRQGVVNAVGAVGTIKLPLETDVRTGVGYGANETELTGELETQTINISESDLSIEISPDIINLEMQV